MFAVKGLTTGVCAGVMNALAEMEVYTSDFILGQIDAGFFPMGRSVNYLKGRKRAFIRIHPLDFRDYIAEHHAHLLDAYDAREVSRGTSLAS